MIDMKEMTNSVGTLKDKASDILETLESIEGNIDEYVTSCVEEGDCRNEDHTDLLQDCCYLMDDLADPSGSHDSIGHRAWELKHRLQKELT